MLFRRKGNKTLRGKEGMASGPNIMFVQTQYEGEWSESDNTVGLPINQEVQVCMPNVFVGCHGSNLF